MTLEQVRKLALSFPEAVEEDHHGRPSFRVRGKIFSTLWPKENCAMVKLSREDQEGLVTIEPEIFKITAWGLNGATLVELSLVDRKVFATLLETAWKRVAPKKLLVEREGEGAKKKLRRPR